MTDIQVWYNSIEEPCCENCKHYKNKEYHCGFVHCGHWKKPKKRCYQYLPKNSKPLTVKELIKVLKTFPQEEHIVTNTYGKSQEILKIKKNKYGLYILATNWSNEAIYNLKDGEEIT